MNHKQEKLKEIHTEKTKDRILTAARELIHHMKGIFKKINS
jgi:hypothetical protein